MPKTGKFFPTIALMSTKSREVIFGSRIRGAKIRAEGARERAKQAVRYEPRHFPYINLGHIYVQRGELIKAIEESVDVTETLGARRAWMSKSQRSAPFSAPSPAGLPRSALAAPL